MIRRNRKTSCRFKRTRLAAEVLEDRRLLAVVLPDLTTGSVGSALNKAGLTALVSSIPSSTLDATPPEDISVLYHAFPQEANDIKVTGDLLNLFLYFNEQNDDIFVQRSLPAFNDDLLEDFNFTLEFIAGVEIPVAHLLGLDFPDVEAIVPNPEALSQFIPPALQGAFNAADQVLGTTIFPELEIFDTTIIPSLSVGDLLGAVIPGPVDDVLIQFVKILGGGRRGGVQLHLLDGNDTADLRELSGVVQEIHGGIGNDVLYGGGSTDPLTILGVTPIAAPANPRIELFGDEGRDTLVVNNRFDVVDYRIHGGAGNDLLLVPGTEFNDIIRIVSDAAGVLQRVEFLAPSSTGGLAQNEIQLVTLPAGATGTFTLTFDGQTTAPIAHDATPTVVETALEALTSISGVTVGGAAGAWTVEFDGAGLANTDQLNMAANGMGLSITGGAVAVAPTVVGGSANYNEIQRVALPAGTTGGTFQLQLGAQATGVLPANADASAIRAAIGALPAVGGTTNVLVTSPNPSGGPWDIEFTAALAGTNQPQLTTVNSRLVGFATGSSAATTTAGVTQVNEIQSFTLSEPAATGSFTATIGGFTTNPAVPADATPLTFQNLLAALPSVGPGNIIVGGTPRNWTLEFTGAFAGTNQPFPNYNIAGLSVGTTASAGTLQSSVAGVNEQKTISIDPAANGGTFTLTFNGETTSPIAYNAPSAAVRSALGALPSINGAQNLNVTGSGPWTVTFVNELALTDVADMTVNDDLIATPQNLIHSTLRQGDTPVNDVQTISLPFNVSGGSFSLSVGGVAIPGSLSATASSAQVEALIETSPAINNVNVTGPAGGPWAVEFLSPNPGTPAPLISGDGSALTLMGINLNIAETQSGSAAGDQLLVTSTITEIDGIEQLQIDLEGGDDQVIFVGAPDFSQGVFVNGGDGTDVIEMQSLAAVPDFQAPIFPDDVAATLQFDNRAIQFADVEGGLVFNAGGKIGDVAVSGTDASNDIRFRSLGGGEATFANDGQVTITLQNFLGGSTVDIHGQQGEDTISLALNGDSQFSQFNINGDGPDGADALRIEGTVNADTFSLTHDDSDAKAGRLVVDGAVTIDYAFIDDLALIGNAGVDSLTVNEPSTGSTDLVLFSPQVGNDGSFRWIGQSGGPETAVVYAPVVYQSIENRNFDTGTGIDTMSVSSDDLPGVNSSAAVVGGNGVTTASFGDQSTTFTHDVTDEDFFAFEIGTADDVVDVSPGVGVQIAVNTALGIDQLNYQASAGAVTLDPINLLISQPGVGNVSYSNAETVRIAGNGANALTVLGAALENRYEYTPLSVSGGRFVSDQSLTNFRFDGIGGDFTIGGGASSRDAVTLLGSIGRDNILVDGNTRTLSLSDAGGTLLKPVILATDIESAEAHGGAGDDRFRVLPSSSLLVQIDGSGPNASDRLLVEDEGLGNLVVHREAADHRSGSITVGSLMPVHYKAVERIDIAPLDPLTGGTGSDGLGRLVVFDADPFEHNESLPNRTDYPALFEVASNPNIDPAEDLFPPATEIRPDEDWYRFDAPRTDTLRFELVFEPIGVLANGNTGLPGDGQLRIDLYDPSNQLIPRVAGEGPSAHTIGVEGDQTYSIRVRGLTPEAINNYDIRVVSLDNLGPQVTDTFITDDLATPADESAFNLFAPKPTAGPTPLVHSLTVTLRDLSTRFPGFPIEALDEPIALAVGNYQVVGDHSGIIPIQSVSVINDPIIIGQEATASITIHFVQPLPDDRFTLSVSDNLIDPVGNRLDGESNADEPHERPLFPSGDGVPEGAYIARFTVDSRAELGVYALGGVYVDTNGNNIFDAESQFSDFTNEDIVYKLGFQSDRIFAGNFVAGAGDVADGFDKLGAYGLVASAFRWLIDTNNNGVPDLVITDPAQVNGTPVAGNFDGNSVNGDEVGIKAGNKWHLDTNHDFFIDTVLDGDMVGLPVVGDFDGDGIDDLGAWADDVFSLDLSGVDGIIDGLSDVSFTFGFPGVREIPIASDFNGDGLDDLGLWNPDGAGTTPSERADWMILVSQPAAAPVLDTARFGGGTWLSTAAPLGAFVADDFVPVDVTQTYQLSGQARSGNIAGAQYEVNNRQYFGFASYDSDQSQILPIHVNKFATATDTRLAAALNPGDTQIVLQNASGWANAGAAHQRSFAWYGYTNSDGFTYPDYTYTRNVASGLWGAGGVVGNVITLNQPWGGPAIPAGMAVRNATSGGTYNYAPLSYQSVPDQWTEYSATLSGTGLAATQFRPGTAFIKPIVLTNYTAGSKNLINWRNIEVSLPAAAVPITDRIVPNPQALGGNVIDFTPVPFGPDLYASFGDAFALPVVGNFDPPVVAASGEPVEAVQTVRLSITNAENALDVDGDEAITPSDALAVINYLNRHGSGAVGEAVMVESDSNRLDGGLMIDVDGDFFITPFDALSVINQLNRQRRQAAAAAAQGEVSATIVSGQPQEEDSAPAASTVVGSELPPQGPVSITERQRTRRIDQVWMDWDAESSPSPETEASLEALAAGLKHEL